MVKHQFIYLNDSPKVSGNAIYVVNHGTKYDIPYSGLIIKKPSWLVIGTQRLKLLDRCFFNLNGSIWINRKDKNSRQNGKKKMLNKLFECDSILIFPEGTWNTCPSLPMLPMAWGVIDLSIKSGCPIVPIAIDYDENNCYINFGQFMYCYQNDAKSEKITELRDNMATLRWEIWEKYFQANRADILPDEWEKEVAARVAAYPPLDFEYEKSCIRKEKNITEHKQAFAHLDTLIPDKQNAFLFNKRLRG